MLGTLKVVLEQTTFLHHLPTVIWSELWILPGYGLAEQSLRR